jgi:outer membrane lipoprotein-sorting protein
MMRSLALCCLLLATPAFAADPTGDEILKKLDYSVTCFKDGTFEAKLRVLQSDGNAREYGFTTFQKNPDKRLVRFTSPGDVKGMGVLIESAETMYVFLPGFQRIRRMGTHIRNQTFMGSDFGFDDMAAISFAIDWNAKLAGQDAGTWQLELTPKPKVETEYAKLLVWVNKDHGTLNKIEYYDSSGKKLKTQTRGDYKQDSPEHWQPGRVSITDHRKNDHQSEIIFSSSKLNTGLGDDLFTQRSLIRGN